MFGIIILKEKTLRDKIKEYEDKIDDVPDWQWKSNHEVINRYCKDYRSRINQLDDILKGDLK
jgi:hypothetical protein